MKRFLLWLVGGALVLILVGFVSLRFYTQTDHFQTWARGQILNILRPAINGEVMFGELDGSWWSNVTLRNMVIRQNGLDVLFIPEATVTYNLLPQLLSFFRSSRFHIQALTLHAPVVNLTQEAKAGWNISQLFKTTEQAEKAPPSQLSIFLDQMAVTNGRLNIQPSDTPSIHLTEFSLAGRLAVYPSGPQVALKTLSFQLARKKAPLIQCNGGAAYDATQSPPMLTLDHVHFRTAHSHLQLTGTVQDFSSPLLALTAEIERLAVADLRLVTPTLALQQDLSGSIHAKGPLSALQVKTTISTTSGEATAEVSADLIHSPQRYEGTLSLQRIIIQDVWPIANLAGTVTARAQFAIAGEEQRTGSFEGHLTETSVQRYHIGDVKLDGTLDNQRLVVNGTTKGSLGNTEWQGNVTLGSPLAYDVMVKARNVEVAQVAPQSPSLPITVNFDTAIAGSGIDMREINGTIKVTLLPSRVGEISDAQGQFLGHIQRQQLTLETFALQAKDTTFTTQGTLLLPAIHKEVPTLSTFRAVRSGKEALGNPPFLKEEGERTALTASGTATSQWLDQLAATLTYDLQSTNITPWLALAGQQGSGGVSLQGKVNGALTALQLTGGATLTNVRMADSSLQSGTINYAFTNLGNPQARGQATVQTTQLDAGIPWRTANLTLTLTEAQPITLQTVFTGQDSQQRTQRIQSQFRYTPEKLEVVAQDILLQLPTGTWRAPRPAQLVVQQQQQAVTIEYFRLQHATSAISAQGTLSQRGPQNLSLQLDRLPLDLMQSFSTTALAVSGHVSATAQIQGTAEQPEIKADVTTSPVTVSGQSYTGMTARVNYRQPQLQLNALVRQDATHTLTVDGTIPLSLSWAEQAPPVSFGEADLLVRSDGLSLAFVNLFAQGVENVQGRVSLDIRVRGPLQALVPTGHAQLENGQVRIPPLSITYDDISLAVQLTPEAVLLSSLRARSGKGVLTGSGKVGLQAYTVTEIDMTLNADAFQVIATREYIASVSGRLTGSGSLQQPVIRGDIQVQDASLRPDITVLHGGPPPPDSTITVVESAYTSPGAPTEPTPSSSATPDVAQNPLYERLAIAIQATIPRNTWVQLPEGTVELMGQVQVQKRANEALNIMGTIETVRGWYSFRGRKFTLERGIIHFTGATPIDPSLDVVARYTLSDYQVEIVVSGTARQPSLDLRSEPTLEQADILSLLVFGKPTTALNAEEKSSLQSQALQTAAGYVASDLREALAKELGLDNLELDVGQTLDKSRIGAGTYITNDIFISTSQQFGEKNAQGFSLEYHLAENWQITVTTTTRGNSGADVVWRKRY